MNFAGPTSPAFLFLAGPEPLQAVTAADWILVAGHIAVRVPIRRAKPTWDRHSMRAWAASQKLPGPAAASQSPKAQVRLETSKWSQ